MDLADLAWIALIAVVIAAFVYLSSKVHGHRPPRVHHERAEATLARQLVNDDRYGDGDDNLYGEGDDFRHGDDDRFGDGEDFGRRRRRRERRW